MDVREHKLRVVVSSPMALALAVGGLWSWFKAPSMNAVLGAAHPQLAELGFKSAAVAAISAAQLMLMVLVVDAIYRRDGFSFVLKVLAAVICLVGGVAAVALVLAGR